MHALRPFLAPASTLFILFLPLVSKYVPSPACFLKGLPTWSATTELGTNNWWLSPLLLAVRQFAGRVLLIAACVCESCAFLSRVGAW